VIALYVIGVLFGLEALSIVAVYIGLKFELIDGSPMENRVRNEPRNN
jgi:hypothetical protein